MKLAGRVRKEKVGRRQERMVQLWAKPDSGGWSCAGSQTGGE